MQSVKISSEDSKGIVVFKWVKVELHKMYWYANMPYLLNYTETPNPTSVEAQTSR